MSIAHPVPVTILTGFLGSGKTTLLNRILRENHGLRIAVLVNDFGSVNVDARLVAGIEEDTINLANGCVCCSMRGDLVSNVKRLLARSQPPEHLVVEASGISDPIGVAAAFTTSALRDRTRVDGVIAMVDAENARNPRLDAQLVRDQIATADIAVLNKTDLIGGEELARHREWIGGIAPRARVLEARYAEIPLEVVLGADRNIRGPGRNGKAKPEEGPAHGLQGWETWTYHTHRPLAYRAVRRVLEALPPDVFRAKGFLQAADWPNLRATVQVVGRRVAIDVDGPWANEAPQTTLVFIGRSGGLDRAALREALDQCATDAIPLLPSRGLALLKAHYRRTCPRPELPLQTTAAMADDGRATTSVEAGRAGTDQARL